jgi:hypothetical protein
LLSIGAYQLQLSDPATYYAGKLIPNASRLVGRSRMFHYSDYLREQAVKYRELAEKAEDAFVKQEFLELADVCEEVANNIDDRRASG